MEPALIHAAAGLSHPFLTASFRDPDEIRARLSAALAQGNWLVGGRYTAADLFLSSPYLWFRDMEPGCAVHPARLWALERAGLDGLTRDHRGGWQMASAPRWLRR